MSQVFISYSSKDAIFADLMEARLKEAGISVWLDHAKLGGGNEWRNLIDHGIASSDVMLVILTPSSCKSPYVTYEWGFALGKEKKVIPVLRENSQIHPRLEVLQYLDFRDPRSASWDELFEEIKKNPNENQTSRDNFIEHYVLFWRKNEDEWAKEDLEAAQRYIGKFGLTAGFSEQEAQNAKRVTIIGRHCAEGPCVSVDAQVSLKKDWGCCVERLDGYKPKDTASLLKDRVHNNISFTGKDEERGYS